MNNNFHLSKTQIIIVFPFFLDIMISCDNKNHAEVVLIIVLKSSLARQINSGLELGWVDEKNRKSHDLVWLGRPDDPVDPVKPGSNPLIFFFTKTTPFWIFFKIEIDPADPVTRSKPKIQTLDWTRFKNYGFKYTITRWYSSLFWFLLLFAIPN